MIDKIASLEDGAFILNFLSQAYNNLLAINFNMAIYSSHAKLAEVLMDNPQLIPVVYRLGIKLGVGDGTIEDVCRIHHTDLRFFLSIINTFLDDEYFPADHKDAFSIDLTIDYLEKTGEYYLNDQLRNIEHHFRMLMQRSGTDNNLLHLQKFFFDMKRQLEESLQYEKTTLFPRLRRRELEGVSKKELLAVNSDIEEKLEDLLTFFVVHLRGSYDQNLCVGVVAAIFALRKDITQNNRIRQRILIPLIEAIS